MLAIHDNPANDAAEALLDVIREIRGRVEVKLYVIAPTINETKRAISVRVGPLRSLRLGPSLSAAATEVLTDGIDRRFAEECLRAGSALSPDEFFGPYLRDLVTVLRSRGIEFFNAATDGYSTRADVVDDINDLLERERSKPPEKHRKGYEQITHDMVLWHFVRDRRPALVEAPLDATNWLATIDLALLGFDDFRRHREKATVPICIHPAALVQMLQFWIPRTSSLEAALFGSLGLPALFHEFDPVTESTTVKILRSLSSFENVDRLPADVTRAILVNESLRQRLRGETTIQREIELVKEALVEENRLKQAALEAEVAEKRRVTEELSRSSTRVGELERELSARTEEARRAQTSLEDQGKRSAATEERLKVLEESLRSNAIERESAEIRRTRRTFLAWSGGCLIPVTIAYAFICGKWGPGLKLTPVESAGLCMALSLLTWVEGVLFLGNRNERIAASATFLRLKSNRRVVWLILGTVAVSVFGSAIYDWMKSKWSAPQPTRLA